MPSYLLVIDDHVTTENGEPCVLGFCCWDGVDGEQEAAHLEVRMWKLIRVSWLFLSWGLRPECLHFLFWAHGSCLIHALGCCEEGRRRYTTSCLERSKGPDVWMIWAASWLPRLQCRTRVGRGQVRFKLSGSGLTSEVGRWLLHWLSVAHVGFLSVWSTQGRGSKVEQGVKIPRGLTDCLHVPFYSHLQLPRQWSSASHSTDWRCGTNTGDLWRWVIIAYVPLTCWFLHCRNPGTYSTFSKHALA